MISYAVLPIAGEIACGDRCGWWETPERMVVAVADGLGHGPEAALAADMAMACIGAALEESLEQLFARCDVRLQTTRGVALSVVSIDKHSGLSTFASVGNIRTLLMTQAKDHRFGAARGIVGGGYARLNPEHFSLRNGDVLALFSDGLDEFTDLRQDLFGASVAVDDQAAKILEKLSNRRDDAALLIYRHGD